ncbi:MAG: alkyl/aryl-sulfatase [Verrucomicrobia bacterium]|nr:alkyl/aryl-sulfatase [Verrucomicrobiota bacterium]
MEKRLTTMWCSLAIWIFLVAHRVIGKLRMLISSTTPAGLLLKLVCCFSASIFLDGVTYAESSDPEARLRQHTQEFRREVIEVDDDVYVAVGYGASNSAMVVGESGLIIIDTKESTASAEAVLKEFRKISNTPVSAIIYTHSHRDHISGAKVFAGNDNPAIYGRAGFTNELVGGVGVGPILGKRTQRQFGFSLKPGSELINVGIGEKVWADGLGTGYVPATVNYTEERYTVTIEGVRIELVAAPGETDDQIYVWLPEKKVLFCGDNFYRAFPNLYPIRGSRYRDVIKWAHSLEKMRREKPEHLVPSHTRPLSGASLVDRALGDYAEAIRYVHDKTVEGMNRGLTPDQLVASVTLPENLAASPYLQEFYGMVPWGVRSVFSGYLGWFDGNPTNLLPLSEPEEARRIVALGGGPRKVYNRLKKAMVAEDYQWVMQLADYLITLRYQVDEVTDVKVKALRALAKQQINAPARNYYLSVAKELRPDPPKILID